MTRLTINNIQFVKEQTLDGRAYGWFVSVKGGASEARDFRDYDVYGRSTSSEYSADRLPKTVQRYIESHRAETFTTFTNPDGSVFTEYIYR